MLLIVTINTTFLFAQKSESHFLGKNIDKSSTESLFVTTNNNAFVTGETLYYNLQCLNPIDFKTSFISKVAYVQLISSDKKIVANQKLFLKNGKGYGDVFIPTNLNSGNYKLVSYTNWMLNKNESSYFVKDIIIVNPYQAQTKNSINKNSAESVIENPTSNIINGLEILTSKKTYSQRELVNFKVKSNEIIDGNYSVSVKKLDELTLKNNLNAARFSKTNTTSEINKTNLILPELRGEIISGKITSKNNENPISNISVGISIAGENFIYKATKTNSAGEFFFNIDKEYDTPNAIVQVIDNNRVEYSIFINESPNINLDNLYFDTNFSLSENVISIIKERAISSQIENAYFDTKKDSLLDTRNTKLFYNSLEKDYLLDNYNRFPTLLETITEVLKEVIYTKNNGKYTVLVNDYNENISLSEPTLILVDGQLIQDVNTILDLKMEDIYKVSIIQGGYFYGPNLYNGMISIISKNHDYLMKLNGDYMIKTNRIIPNKEKKYFAPEYAITNNNERIPDYRHQLLWLPNYDINELISFYTSDVKGTFELTIDGFTNEGLPVSITETFDVK
ncbi:hypothetical protein [Flavobacterium sp.]|uniref:hypothetical protein n=1 Tax=Flavobacterium sp. TaxID=239 RepID=UPI003750AD9F